MEKRTPLRQCAQVAKFSYVAVQYRSGGARILTRFPFVHRRNELRACIAFAKDLGSPHPGPINVHPEPLPTSALLDRITVIATTTKICTRDRFRPAYAAPCVAISTYLLLITASHVRLWTIISLSLQRHPFSALLSSAGELLHTP